jgi:hypothetical protein
LPDLLQAERGRRVDDGHRQKHRRGAIPPRPGTGRTAAVTGQPPCARSACTVRSMPSGMKIVPPGGWIAT